MGDRVARLCAARQREEVARLTLNAEQHVSGVSGEGNAVDQAGASVVQNRVGGESDGVQSSADLPHSRIHPLAENAVDPLTVLGLLEGDVRAADAADPRFG